MLLTFNFKSAQSTCPVRMVVQENRCRFVYIHVIINDKLRDTNDS